MRLPVVFFCAVLLAALLLGLGGEPAVAQAPSGGTLSQYIAADFWAGIVIHPARIAKSPLWADLPKDKAAGLAGAPMGIGANEAAALAQLMQGITPDKVRRVVMLVGGQPEPQDKLLIGIIVQFEDELASRLMDVFSKDSEPAQAGSSKYLKTKQPFTPGATLCVAAPDSRILLLAGDATLQRMLTPPASQQPLLEELRRASLDNDVVAAVLVAELAKAAGTIPDQAKPVIEAIKSSSAALNFSGDTLLKLDLFAVNDGAAAGLQMQLSMVQTLAAQQVQAIKQQPPPLIPPPLAETLVPVLEEIVLGLGVVKDAEHVSATIKMPTKLPALVKALAAMGPMMMPPGALPAGGPPASEPPKEPSPKEPPPK